MCGICGFIYLGGWPPAMLQAMNDVIFRRGPDAEGFLHSGTVGLAMREPAIDGEHSMGREHLIRILDQICEQRGRRAAAQRDV